MSLFRRSLVSLFHHSLHCHGATRMSPSLRPRKLCWAEVWCKSNVKYFTLSSCDSTEAQPQRIKKQRQFSHVNQVKFFEYFRNNWSYFTSKPILSEEVSDAFLKKPLNEVTNDELPTYVSTAFLRKKWTVQLQKDVDQECVVRLKDLSTDQLLSLVDAWLYIVPNILNSLSFYPKTVDRFGKILHESSCDSPQFIQTYFYASLYKNKTISSNVIKVALDKLQSHLPELRALSVEELAVISVSTFRTSVTVRSRQFLQLVSDSIKLNLDFLLINQFYFSCLIKVLRPAEFLDLKLLDALAKNLGALESMHFVTKVHTLALFAESLYSNESFLQQFVTVVGSELKGLLENKATVTIRVKDVSRFLYCLSYLGIVPAVDNLDREVTDKISEWIDRGYFNEGSDIIPLVSMMASIFVLNWKYDDLCKKVFEKFPADKLKFDVPNHPKNLLLYNLLVSGLKIEAPHLITEELSEHLDPSRNPTIKKHLLTRPILKQLRNTVWLLTRRMNVTGIECFFNVPHVLIAGISFYTPKGNLIHLEVLDSTNCLTASSTPHGLMKLKLRLIKCLKQPVMIIDAATVKQRKNNMFLFMIENKINDVDEGNSSDS